jgi:mRNA turnover protein 4
MGSNKVLQVALGKTPADELATNLSLLSAKLAGQVGLLFTRLAKDEVRGRFNRSSQLLL